MLSLDLSLLLVFPEIVFADSCGQDPTRADADWLFALWPVSELTAVMGIPLRFVPALIVREGLGFRAAIAAGLRLGLLVYAAALMARALVATERAPA